MRWLRADLHVHTALSPCAADEMTPPAIVAAALRAELDMIAICDHNAAGNVRSVQEAAGDALCVIAGIEITTAEEVHVLGLFPGVQEALEVADAVKSTLARAQAPARGFGVQRLMDSGGNTIGVEDAMLSAASAFGLSEALALVHGRGGLAIAAHADRPAFGVLGHLGRIPEDARFDAVELSAAGSRLGRAAEIARLGLPVVCSSDGHSPDEVGAGVTLLCAAEASFPELTLALGGRGGREVICA